MTALAVEELAMHPAPAFWCYGVSAYVKPEFLWLAPVEHRFNPPAAEGDLEQIQEMLGESSTALVAFYRKHNGFLLYKDCRSDAAGIELLPVQEWSRATDQLRGWLGDLSAKEDPDDIRQGVAIGEVPQSGNCFVIPISGPNIAKVFYVNHDGWYESPFAKDFEGFLERVTQAPAKLLAEDLGGYIRYSDGQTGIAWIPQTYIVDARDIETS